MKNSAKPASTRIRSLWLKTFFLLFILSLLLWLIISFVTTVDTTVATHNWETLKGNNFSQEPIWSKPPLPTTIPTTTIRGTRITDLEDIKHVISIINREEKIYHEDKFGPVQNDSLVIIVQVHNRISYLKHFVASLSLAKGISNVLLVFSHDFYDEDINALIRSITFCKVMQIFYPYAIQMYPAEFPGPDPLDCGPDISKDGAMKMLCKNAMTPDHNGKYRNPASVQVKHHWWWKANKVFDLTAAMGYNGLVLFLEEDLYLVEDFIPALKLMETAADNCDSCKILSLADNGHATHLDQANFDKSDRATVTSKFSNMGLAFNRLTWGEMVDCRHGFCVYDDYNWDFSLQHIFTTCMNNTAAVTLDAPRIFHLGTCGLHFKSNNCDPSEMVDRIHKILTEARNRLYPNDLSLYFFIDHSQITGGYGGWGDPRDRALCLGMTMMN